MRSMSPVGAVRTLRRAPFGAALLATDTVLAATLAAATLLWADQYRPDTAKYHFRSFDGLAVALTLIINLPVAVRRLAAWPVLIVTTSGLAVYSGLGYQPSLNIWVPLLAFYTVAARSAPRVAAVGAVLTAAVWFQSAMSAKVISVVIGLAQTVVGIGVVWAFGDRYRRLGERNAELARLTEQLHEERAEHADRAVADERVRIARELHDVVAHHMSVISVQVGLARYVLATDPPTATTAMETIATTTHEALQEMRRLLAVLRPGDAEVDSAGQPLSAAPGLARLEDLLERVRAAGVLVALTVSGEPIPLAAGADLCAYRVIQESLTNVLKHTRSARAEVSLSYGPGNFTARIRDDGGARVPAVRAQVSSSIVTRDGARNGLIGMRERARLYGGTLSAGREADGGFEVVLALPLDGPDLEPDGPP